MAKPIIEVVGLRKVYKIGEEKVVALNNVSLTVEKGEFCCILGTSGSGKSTLLNMIAGLEKPTRGKIIVDGCEVSSYNEKQLATFRQGKVGFVFQSYNLLPTMTALDNVALPLIFLGESKKARRKKAKEILKAVGLQKYIMHKPTEMSGGQQQRVGIARAYVNIPPIVFADEPTGNLDTKTTAEVMTIILSLAEKNNQTLVLVTHNPDIAQYANKIVHIIDGDIEKIVINENPAKPVIPSDHREVSSNNKTPAENAGELEKKTDENKISTSA